VAYHRPPQIAPASLLLAQTTPSHRLPLPTQTQKPPCAPRAVHMDKDFDGVIKSEDDDEDDHPRGGDGKRSLITRQAVLVSVVGSSHVFLETTERG